MLRSLSIRNIGLIEDAELSFDAGLTVLTGETGVGKTMLLGALGALRGDRARGDLLRSGADEGFVRGAFLLGDSSLRARVAAIAPSAGAGAISAELSIERVLRKSGRHTARLNGEEVSLSILSQVGTLLFEIQGQRSQLALLVPTNQLESLDRYAALGENRAAFRDAFAAARALAARIDFHAGAGRERDERRAFLAHVAGDLERAGLVRGEREALAGELALLEESDSVLQQIRGSVESLYDGEASALDRITGASRAFAPLAALHSGLAEFAEHCEGARASLDEAVRALRAVEEELQQDPARLEQARERFHEWMLLEERYRRRGDELIDYFEDAKRELQELAEGSEQLPVLEGQLRAGLEDLGARARTIGRKRRETATKLAAAVAVELGGLGLKNACFEVRVEILEPDEGWHGFNETGGDQVEILFGANPGEPARPLRDAASGGELSRVMLALKRVLAKAEAVPILIFDEVDAGVGGRLGAELGRKMREIGATHQVICVTHLPQIASFAACHYRVAKRVEKGRTRTVIERLDAEHRVDEIAAMIRGKERTRTSLAEAREMLEQALGAKIAR